MLYYIPIDPKKIKDITPEDSIDMHSFRFGSLTGIEYLTIIDPQLTALMFLRNTGIKAKLIFDDCTYEEKEAYLIAFMLTKRMSVTTPELSSTWAHILTDDTKLISILTEDEVCLFKERNNDLISELYRFMVSIPLCAMDIYSVTRHEDRIDMNEFPVSNYNQFNHFALVQLFDYRQMIIASQSIEGIEPVFYQNYFRSNQCDVYPGFIGDLINKFPHLQLINIIMNNDPELTDSFVNGVINMFQTNHEE